MSIQLQDGLSGQPVDRVLEDLLVRFLVNAPDEDLSSIERIFFQVEEAQWFYLDFVRQLNPLLPTMKMKSFAPALLSKCPLLWRWGDPRDAISKFGKYKSTIPVRGIALMNKELTKIVLVQGMESGSWSFPRGKISKGESDLECAIREVREETGFDAKAYVNEKDFVERTVFGKNMKIFLARGVPEDTEFAALSRFEISSIKWFDLKKLQKSLKNNPQKFFAVDPIIKALTTWVNKNKGLVNEEQLLREAEAKLKAIMGIGVSKENDQAGRELLDILQGASQPESQAPQSAPQEIRPPQQPQIPNFNHQVPLGYPPNGFVPQQPLPQAYYPMLPPAHLLPPRQQPFMPPAHLLRPLQEPQSLSPQIQSPHPQVQSQTQQPSAEIAQSRQHPQSQTPQDQLKSKGTISEPPHELPKDVQHLSQYQTQPLEPSAQSLSLPKRISTSKNSKEFLSLLQQAPKGSSHDQLSEASVEAKQRNRSRADDLLKLFQKQEPSRGPSESGVKSESATTTEMPHSQLEDEDATELDATNRSTTPKKITLLKRDKDQNASATLLGLLGKKPPTRDEDASSKSRSPAPHPASKPTEPQAKPQEPENPSSTLLDILNGKNTSASAASNPVSSPQPVSSSASADLLGILKKGKDSNSTNQAPKQSDKPIRLAKKSAETPIDLKAILTGEGSRSGSTQQSNTSSPVTTTSKANKPGNDILDILNRKSATPDTVRITPQQSQTPENFEDFEDFEDFDNFEDDGEFTDSQVKPYVESTDDDDFEDAHAVPQAAHSTGDSSSSATYQSKPDGLQDIYGTSNETINLQNALPPQRPQNENGANLLALLGKKPPSQVAHLGVPKPADNGRNELLNILRRGPSNT
ncbi:uncharacterized protein CXQ87_002786 [Candidozyma duobushaemuli]|uniref:Nudix hydrolase domain-containing protein n=2 Tax=Candidozyma TaxID=3303203 RepID=A0ABX8I288_9ASCO|nr:uncharacterized protein CXQ87_002786 [[Candida] duobushaemulonis]PVH14639.1 hypothetical protein CXQ87_002786 [[Candida] duobushaemulonis]QWU87209.1 hypothetical protein CA3LBN_001474 [[Candida] haemuloni]